MMELFDNLPRRRLTVTATEKEQIWLKVQNHIRRTRLAQTQSQTSFVSWPIFRFGKSALAVLVLVVAVGLVGGATKASEGSLPGDTLYPVKKAAEKVEKVFAGSSEEAKVKIGIKHAKRRLEEVKSLVAGNNKTEVVAETLEALKTATEQVVSTAEASEPELIDHAVELVTQEVEVLNTMKNQVAEGEIKQALRQAIFASQESINKLKGGEETEQVKGTATEEDSPAAATSTSPISTPAKPAAPKKPKIPDGVIESNIQIDSVIKFTNPQSSQPDQPQVLPEPSAGF